MEIFSEKTYKSIKVKSEIYRKLKELDSSPSRAIENLIQKKGQNTARSADAETLKRIAEIETLIEKIVKANNLRTY